MSVINVTFVNFTGRLGGAAGCSWVEMQGGAASTMPPFPPASIQQLRRPGHFAGDQYAAFEACGKCKAQQGGASTFTAGLKFVQKG
jgi:hypothetical protein